jgi:predicted ATPase
LAGHASFPERCVSVFDPVVGSLAESARNFWITGRLARVVAECEAAVALGRELRHPDSLAFAWVFHAWMHGYLGEWRTCLASADAGAAIARESGSIQTMVWNQCVHGWALAHLGEPEKGERELAEAMDRSKAIMGQVAMPQFNAMMVEVLLLRGELAAAEARLDQALELERIQDDRYFSAEVHRLSALCHARRGRIEAARVRLHEAIEIARAQGASTFELRAALSLAEVAPEEGRERVRVALAAYPEPEPWPEVQAAQRLVPK